MKNVLKSCIIEICLKRIRVNQGVGVFSSFELSLIQLSLLELCNNIVKNFTLKKFSISYLLTILITLKEVSTELSSEKRNQLFLLPGHQALLFVLSSHI